jgi:small subunit ribosomal protein S13
MPRVAGVEIPENKPIAVSLRYIYGIGPKNAMDILNAAGVDGQIRANKLNDDQLSKISSLIDNDYQVEGALRRQISQNISRLREIGCYRGMRHRKSLPVHGQRTRTNARTRKGPRKTVAGKKGVKEMQRG